MKSIKIKGVFIPLALTTALAVPLLFIAGVNHNNIQCTSSSLANAHIANACIAKHNANHSWLAWVGGSSRSTQFQFIDLFELLHGDKDKSRKAVIPTREG